MSYGAIAFCYNWFLRPYHYTKWIAKEHIRKNLKYIDIDIETPNVFH